MPVEIFIKAYYQASPDAMFDQALQLHDVAATRHASTSSRIAEGDVYHPKTSALKSLTAGSVQIKIDRICHDARVLESTETSRAIPCLRHRLHIKSAPTGAVWTDRIMVEAGPLTPFVSRYIMYLHHKRHAQRGATRVERFSAKSYRAAQVGLPMFQTLERNHPSHANGLSAARSKPPRADIPKIFARAAASSR